MSKIGTRRFRKPPYGKSHVSLVRIVDRKFRANPFENSEGRNDRTTFHLDQIDILSWLAIEIKENNSEDFEAMEISNGLLDCTQEEVEHELRMSNVLKTINQQIEEILAREKEGNANDIQILEKVLLKEARRIIQLAHEVPSDLDVQVRKYAHSKGYDDYFVEQWSRQNSSDIKDRFDQPVDATQPIAYRGIMKRNILSHPDGSIDIASKLANEILSTVTTTGLPRRTVRTLKNNLFDYQYQTKRINQSWAGLLLYHICERFFYLEKLGMGYLKAIKKEDYDVDERILYRLVE